MHAFGDMVPFFAIKKDIFASAYMDEAHLTRKWNLISWYRKSKICHENYNDKKACMKDHCCNWWEDFLILIKIHLPQSQLFCILRCMPAFATSTQRLNLCSCAELAMIYRLPQWCEFCEIHFMHAVKSNAFIHDVFFGHIEIMLCVSEMSYVGSLEVGLIQSNWS